MITNRTLVPHLLRTLATIQIAGDAPRVQTLSKALRVRRADVQRTLVALHYEGLFDAAKMRLTLRGFALGAALKDVALPALRRPQGRSIAAA